MKPDVAGVPLGSPKPVTETLLTWMRAIVMAIVAESDGPVVDASEQRTVSAYVGCAFQTSGTAGVIAPVALLMLKRA